jgi:HK97 family phage prohead protease
MTTDLVTLEPAAARRMEAQQARSLELQASKAADGGATTIGCYGVGYGVINLYGRVFVPGAFAESLDGFSDEKPLPIGWMHDIPIGKFTTLRDEQRGPYLEGPLSQTSAGQDAAVLVQDGLTAVSVGFFPLVYQFAEPGEQVSFDTPYGRVTYTFDEFVVYIVKADLVECSLVLVGADDEARVVAVQSLMEKATRALPGLAGEASWEELAYSMALFMGGRGAGAFADATDLDHHALYQKLAAGYGRLGKTAPAYARQPKFDQVAFQHDERVIFQDRYLRKSLAAVTAGAGGIDGPLSAETCAEAERAIAALEPLTRRSPDHSAVAGELAGLAASIRQATEQLTASRERN